GISFCSILMRHFWSLLKKAESTEPSEASTTVEYVSLPKGKGNTQSINLNTVYSPMQLIEKTIRNFFSRGRASSFERSFLMRKMSPSFKRGTLYCSAI